MEDAVRELMSATRKKISELEQRLADAEKWRRDDDPRTALGVLEHCAKLSADVHDTIAATRVACRFWEAQNKH